MGVLRIDHPDVMEFITAKRTPGRWNNFNVSVGVTDAFMQALDGGSKLGTGAPCQTRCRAHGPRAPSSAPMACGSTNHCPHASLWDTVMRSTYDFAEPGILFLDHINRDNNLRYCEKIAATNPCGEQPLPPTAAAIWAHHPDALCPPSLRFCRLPAFDFEAFEKSVAIQVRALDNVLDVTFWPLPQQRDESAAKRRIGVGFTGMGNALAMLCLRYDAAEGREMAARIATHMRDAAYRASVANWRRKRALSPNLTPTVTWPRHLCQPPA
jgi:ribonucleoside-diphosphate reductase alpha chain